MTRYNRLRRDGGTYFFTVVTHERRPFLVTDLARECLRAAWIETTHKRPFVLDAVCLLPDHLHCIWTLPEGDDDFSTRWSFLKSAFTRRWLNAGGIEGERGISRKRRGEAAVWQRRFWEHCIRDDEDYRRHMDYIHFNPVKHELVARAGDWPHSTFARYVKKGIYESEWGSMEPKHIVSMSSIVE